jgi:hypothetical protein
MIDMTAQHAEKTQPVALYTSNDKKLRKRTFKCPMCADAADGSHQCGACFRHVHGFCGEPWPGSAEGYEQVRMCEDCLSQEYDVEPQYEAGAISQADYDELRRMGLAHLGLHNDRDALTPDDHGYRLFTRLNTLDPNMDLNEYYALLDIFKGPHKTLQVPSQTNVKGIDLYEKGSAGKQKWAQHLLTTLQITENDEETLKRQRLEEGDGMKTHKTKK